MHIMSPPLQHTVLAFFHKGRETLVHDRGEDPRTGGTSTTYGAVRLSIPTGAAHNRNVIGEARNHRIVFTGA